MDDATLITKLKGMLLRTAGWDGDKLAADRKAALDYYFQRPRGDEVPGRSQVVSGDVSAMVEANLAQMLDAFTNSQIIEFHSFDMTDEDQAQLESDAVTYLVMERNNGFMELATAIKDALLQRNGIIKIWADVRHYPDSQSFENVIPEALSQMLEMGNEPGRLETTVKKYDPDTGELSLRVVETRTELRVEAVEPDNFFFLETQDRIDLQHTPFVAERHVDRRSDLIELGFPKAKVNELKAYTGDTTEQYRALRGHQERVEGLDNSQDEIEWFEAYVLYDSDGDGIAERHRVSFSRDSDIILEDEIVPLVPYAAGVAILNPHRFLGISLWDKLRQIQDERTGLKRALLDNVNTVTKNRLAYLDGKVNVDDVSDGRPNGAIRVNGKVADIRAAVMPFEVPDNSPGVLSAIQQSAQERSEMGGAALDMAAGHMQLNDRVGSEGLDRAYSVMEQLAAMMTKTIAATLIRSTMLLAHATLREHFESPVPIKLQTGKWESPVPAQWRERDNITVKIGMSPGERSRKQNALREMLDAQLTLAKEGMDEVLVDINGFYRLLMDFGRASEIQNPEQYFLDPESDESQMAMQQKQQQAQEIQRMQEQLMQQAVQLEQTRTALEKYRHDSQLQHDYWKEVLQAEIKEAELVGTAATELLKEDGRDRANGQGAAEAVRPGATQQSAA